MKIIMTNHCQEAVFKNYQVSLSSNGNQTSKVSQVTLKILPRVNGKNSSLLLKLILYFMLANTFWAGQWKLLHAEG